MKKIVVIGDSHSQLFANNPNFKRGLWIDLGLEEMFDVRWMGPVTYWRLCRDQSEFIGFSRNILYTPYSPREFVIETLSADSCINKWNSILNG